MYTLSLLLPVHNEADGIDNFITDVIQNLNRRKFSYEVICIENGSTDKSFEKLSILSKKYKQLTVIQSEKGWGNAVRAGINKAKGMYTCFMVSDGQIDPLFIYKLMTLAKNFPEYQLVKVWRTTRENQIRFVNSRFYNGIAQLILGIKSWDINASPKLLETKLLKSIPFTAPNIGFDVELMWHLQNRKLSWLEIPIPSKKRASGASTTKPKLIWEMIKSMIFLRLYNRAER